MVVLIIGLGSISKKHISALKEICEELTIYALRSSKDAKHFDGIINIRAIDEIEEKVDFAIVSNPSFKHYSTIQLLIENSIPMFVEKPALDSLVGSKELLEKLNSSSLINYVACNLRFHPCIQFIKKYFTSNPYKRVNEVNIYCGSYLPNWRPQLNFKEVYSANKDQGGGVHLDLFHEIDYAYWWFGIPNKTTAILTSKSTLEIDAIDYANYILEYDNFNVSVILNYFRLDTKRTAEIVFEDDTFLIDLLTNKITNKNNEIVFSEEGYNVLDTYIRQMDYFISHLNSTELPMNTLSESINALKITLVNE